MFIGCEDETVPDTKAPTVVISSPSEGDEFDQQGEIIFESVVTDDSALESVSISITPPGEEAQVVHTANEETFTNGNKEVSVSRAFPLSMGGELAAGSYLLTVHASDIHGNTTNKSVSVIIKESDAGAPLITFSKPTEGAEFKQNEEISVEAAIADNAGLTAVTISVTPPGGEAQKVHTEDFTGKEVAEASISEEISLGAEAEPGEYIISIVATDAHGNTSSKSVTIRLREPDTSAPTLTISNPTAGMEFNSDDVISIEARATDNVGLEAYGISITPPGGEAQVVHTKDFSANSTEGNIQETIRLDAGATEGNYVLTIEVTDADRNSARESVSISVKVPDAEAPGIAISKPAEGAVFTTEEEIPVEASLTDNTGLVTAKISITPPAGQVQEVYTETFSSEPAEATISHTISLTGMPAGSYIVTVEATDKDGHSRDKKVNVVVREPDHTAPTVNISSPSAGTEFYANEAIQLRAKITDNAALEEVTVWVTSPAGEAKLVHTEDPVNFFNNDTEATIEEAIKMGTENTAAGTYTITVRAIDAAGNATEEEVSINMLEADTHAPTITVHSPEAESSYVHGEVVSLDAIVEDDRKLAKIRVTIMLENSVSMYDNTITEFDSDTRHQVLDSLTIPADAPTGTYYVTITATDAAGNTSEKVLTFLLTKG